MALIDNIEFAGHLNNDWLDSSGNGHNGIPNGATFDAVNKKLGSHCGNWDGLDDNVDFGIILNIGTGPVSISTWIKVPAISSGTFNIFYLYLNTVNRWALRLLDDGKIQFFSKIGGVDGPAATSATGGMDDDNWHNVICTRNGGTYKVYADGVYEGVGSGIVHSLTLAENWLLGCRSDDTEHKVGKIDEPNVWVKTLTDGGVSLGQVAGGEVAEIWNGGVGIEYPFSVEAAIGARYVRKGNLFVPSYQKYGLN
jgi:hypothetical protein